MAASTVGKVCVFRNQLIVARGICRKSQEYSDGRDICPPIAALGALPTRESGVDPKEIAIERMWPEGTEACTVECNGFGPNELQSVRRVRNSVVCDDGVEKRPRACRVASRGSWRGQRIS